MAKAAVTGTLFLIGLVGVGALGALGVKPPNAEAGTPISVPGIPPAYFALYVQAAKKYKLDWAILAAIGKVETDHGRIQDGCATSSAGARGPMQFMPGTWAGYGNGGDICDPRDAIPAAARYLKASGAPKDYRRAIFAYNHAGWYVDKVLAQARKYRAAAVSGATTVPFGDSSADAIRAAADELDRMGIPYVFGGGHANPAAPDPGLDCSSSVSWVMQHAGFGSSFPTMTSGMMEGWGDAGPGRLITIYANPTHVFMKIGTRFFGTSGSFHASAGGGPHWFAQTPSAGYLGRFTMRHPPGL